MGHRVVSLDVLLTGAIVALRTLVRRRRGAPAPPARMSPDIPSPLETPSCPVTVGQARDPRLAEGVQDIRRTDPGFDPSRFVGYAAMTFRDVQYASTTEQIAALRDRVTPEMYGRLQAQWDRRRDAAGAHHVEAIEIVAEISEAWQEGGRDYVTASIRGSLVDVAGSSKHSRLVEESCTFTRPAGLNFWMLSAVRCPGTRTGEDLV